MQEVNIYLELEKALKMLQLDWGDIEWSHLRSCCYKINNKKNEAILKPDYSQGELEAFKQDVVALGDYLDIPDEQQLFGVVVFRNGAWLERHHLDKHWRWHYTRKPEYEAFIKTADERIDTGE